MSRLNPSVITRLQELQGNEEILLGIPGKNLVYKTELSDLKNALGITALENVYTETIVNITSAKIRAIGSSPIELLPAPGVGKYYDVEKIIIEYNHVTTNYTSANLAIQGTGGNFYALLYPFDTQNTIAIINSQWENLEITEQYPIYYQTPLNEGLNITTVDNSNPTLGNGTLRAIITYTVRTFGA